MSLDITRKYRIRNIPRIPSASGRLCTLTGYHNSSLDRYEVKLIETVHPPFYMNPIQTLYLKEDQLEEVPEL